MICLVVFLLAPAFANNWKDSSKAADFPLFKVMSVVVQDSQIENDGEPSVSIMNENVTFPAYLTDLRNTEADVTWNMKHPCKYTWGEDEPGLTMDLDQVAEISITGKKHPPHIHVNHMQVIEGSDDWYQVGRWFDNIRGDATVRLPAKDFAGDYVFHCHWLQHEDLGCMGVVHVNTDEEQPGRTYTDADASLSTNEAFKVNTVDHKTVGAELVDQTQVIPTDSDPWKLYLDQYYYDGHTAQYWTRAYNQGIPGPQFKINAGQTFTIELHNLLGANKDTKVVNTFHSPNTTNLHTHGLHVSSFQPGDDNLHTVVEPGKQTSFTYTIPDDHLGGTHWYHPHYHGSTALQVGGGAHGMIIVEDADGALAEPANSAEQKVMMITNMPQKLDHLAWLEEQSEGDIQRTLADEEFLLVNGQYQPKMTLNKNQWYRIRMGVATMNYFVTMDLNTTLCEYYLLATDGVYLPDGLVPITQIAGSSGNRADILMRCNSVGNFDIWTVESSGEDDSFPVWAIILIVVGCVLLIAGVGFMYYRTRKGGEAGSAAEKVQVTTIDSNF